MKTEDKKQTNLRLSKEAKQLGKKCAKAARRSFQAHVEALLLEDAKRKKFC